MGIEAPAHSVASAIIETLSIARSDAPPTSLSSQVLLTWMATKRLDAKAMLNGHRHLFADTQGVGPRRSGTCHVRCRHSGAVIYTPPAADRVCGLLDDLGDFMAADGLPVIAKAFVAMLQLLLIHPFTDGNGRCARLLFAAICARGGCDHPIVLLALARLYGRGGTRLHAGSTVLRATGSWQSYLDSCARSVEEASSLWHEHAGSIGASTARAENNDSVVDAMWWRAASGP